jgi:hypothetical protein
MYENGLLHNENMKNKKRQVYECSVKGKKFDILTHGDDMKMMKRRSNLR